jgi:Domain of unknown function (DUF4787)
MFAEGWRPRPRLCAVTAVLLLVHAAGVQARSNSKVSNSTIAPCEISISLQAVYLYEALDYTDTQGSRAYRERKAQCELESCSKFVPEEAMNCLHQCISPACYQSIYAAEPVSSRL